MATKNDLTIKSGEMEMDRLEKYLQKRGINYERAPKVDAITDMTIKQVLGPMAPEYGETLVVSGNNGNYVFDAIYGFGAYGNAAGPLEIKGDIVENDEDEVEGFLSAADIVEKIERLDPQNIIEQGKENPKRENEKESSKTVKIEIEGR